MPVRKPPIGPSQAAQEGRPPPPPLTLTAMTEGRITSTGVGSACAPGDPIALADDVGVELVGVRVGAEPARFGVLAVLITRTIRTRPVAATAKPAIPNHHSVERFERGEEDGDTGLP